jgi:hypothetical protein
VSAHDPLCGLPDWVPVGDRECDCDLAHAEVVAARLVEEVCRDEVLIQALHGALIMAADERDAARAEVAALQVFAQDANEAFASGRREVLADLRAKVEGLRDEAIWARRGTVAENGLDTVPSAWHNGRTSLADAVLALIEEAGR